MDQTTEQVVQPDVTQTTTLTAEQPAETTATPTVDFKSLIPEEYREEKSIYKTLVRWMTLLNHISIHRRW